MTIHALDAVAQRAKLIAYGAAQWRDPASETRAQARDELVAGIWPAPTVEAALDNALWDLDDARSAELAGRVYSGSRAQGARTIDARSEILVILPGNVIGPAIQAAYCAAIAGANVTLKASSDERHLAAIVSRQFDQLGEPLAGTAKAVYWPGGDIEAEAKAFAAVQRIIAFGESATIDSIRARARDGVEVIGYGESFSVAYVHADADLTKAAAGAARDVCLFDQRGCMSPQTIYVQGDAGRALLFGRAVAREVENVSRTMPRAPLARGERELVADALRRFAASAMEPMPHGLDTLVKGQLRDSVPEFIVAVEAFGPPTCLGFGRIAVVKPCPGARELAVQLKRCDSPLDTLGICAGLSERDRSALRLAGAKRICELGEMQRPPLGYRPAITDFTGSNTA